MIITSATFVKGVTDIRQFAEDTLPHVAFIGRSNVGKSSTINLLTKQKALAKTSATPGRTKELNVFLINHKYYLVDLPGYGYAKASPKDRAQMQALIGDYLFVSTHVQQKVVLIIDAVVGPTDADMEMLHALEQSGKSILVIANKIDKVKKSQLSAQLKKIQGIIGAHAFVPYSAEKKIGIPQILEAIDK